MSNEQIDKIYALLDRIKITKDNEDIIEDIKDKLERNDMVEALNLLSQLQKSKIEYKDSDKKTKEAKDIEDIKEKKEEENKENFNENEETSKDEIVEKKDKEQEKKEEENLIGYPEKLGSDELERKFIGKLLNEIKAIAIYYFPFKECYFVNDDLLNIYKSILFTDAEKYAPESAKKGFNFAKRTVESDRIKYQLKNEYMSEKATLEEIYTDLKKTFTLRKYFLANPVKTIQKEIAEILNYKLYKQMSVEEVESAIEQVTVTEKFKRAVLNKNITDFLVKGNNTLTNGLELPFAILSSVFKGIRQGETMAFAMPSNAGKSRFTMNIAAYTALIHKKKVLIISNEMSEEKMKLCLITTIINNPEIQKMHGQKLHKTEGEILEFKYRADSSSLAKVDEEGFVIKEENESHKDFIKRLEKESTEFRMTTAVTDWFNDQVNNYMYFINITDHTNDELKKVIMNYYYKEKVEYVFYDTLKTDIDNIGNGEEIKRTATILANLAQNFKMFIASTLQLAETNTDPVNLNINDLAVSRTVKEVLDTLCLFKQIHNEDLEKYEYSLEEVDTKFYDLEKSENPDVRYYTCVVDKNRAGSKPKLVFKLNLAYNDWEELGYVRLKS